MLSAVLLLAAGCGGSAEDDVRSAWEEAAHAAADGEATTFCSLVTEQGKRTITSRTRLACEDAVRLLSSTLTAADKAAIRDAEITKVEMSGDRATVAYRVNAALAKVGFTGRTAMSRVEGHWLLRGV